MGSAASITNSDITSSLEPTKLVIAKQCLLSSVRATSTYPHDDTTIRDFEDISATERNTDDPLDVIMRKLKKNRSSPIDSDAHVTNTSKELLSAIANVCKDNKSSQDSLKGYIKDILQLIFSSTAIVESLQTILCLCMCYQDDNHTFHALTSIQYNIDNIDELGTYGACEIVVSLLEKFGDRDLSVAKLGFCVIYCLAFSEINRTKLGFNGACESVIYLLNTYGEIKQSFAEVGCWTIYRLSFNNNLNKSKLGADIGCEVVVEVLKEYGKCNPLVAEAGCYAISNLASNHDINNEELGKCGACEIVIELLKLYSKSNVGMAEAGCLAACNLAFIESNRDKLGICTILKEIWFMYSESNATIRKCEDIILILQ